MLNLTDLSADRTLDKAAMSGVSGGYAFAGDAFGAFFGIVNAPEIDLGTHLLAQEQAVAVDQSNAIGGFNVVGANQTQNGISGQVSVF
ncbi:hypothetical protein G3480_18435 [Thiorhodococcus mannitoliphagus]|uniref:Uncharacterized protein n=2 Tax=Thiorhodococcus mannitoliphagus TaxID=329406 RepID=A0A6P1DX47_9GAMM|nr:hypothetical protein [Thiorhodococcus mannitoliphagus]NEX22259.1 hypothetical protein [Thiorhodococcus mannitoliphagus]